MPRFRESATPLDPGPKIELKSPKQRAAQSQLPAAKAIAEFESSRQFRARASIDIRLWRESRWLVVSHQQTASCEPVSVEPNDSQAEHGLHGRRLRCSCTLHARASTGRPDAARMGRDVWQCAPQVGMNAWDDRGIIKVNRNQERPDRPPEEKSMPSQLSPRLEERAGPGRARPGADRILMPMLLEHSQTARALWDLGREQAGPGRPDARPDRPVGLGRGRLRPGRTARCGAAAAAGLRT